MLYPWKSKQVRFCRTKDKAEYLQTNQISGLGNKETLDHVEEDEEEVLKMSLEEQIPSATREV